MSYEHNGITNETTVDTRASQEHQSETLGEIFGALAKAQLEMEVAKMESKNPFFKSNYADLPSVVKASRPHLAKNGLCVIQRVIPLGGVSHLVTRLGHASGEWLESQMPINPPKADIQTLGSYITYLRRYSYAAMVGVVAANEDDDGEKAMAPVREIETAPARTGISKQQLEILARELEGHNEILEGVINGFKLGKLSDLPASKYTQCLERIREIKRAKES